MDYAFLKQAAIICLFCSLLFSPFSSITAQCDPTALDLPHNGIDEDCDLLDGLYQHMPSYVYMVEGKEFDFFYRNVFLSKHPADYTFEVETTLPGMDVDGTHWHYTPTATDVGEHPFTFKVKDNTGLVYTSASSTVRVASAQSPGFAQKRFVQLGHSLVDQGVMVYFLRQHLDGPGNPAVSMHGTHVSYVDGQTHHQGMGGTSWRYYHQDSLSPLLRNGQLDIRSYFDSITCVGCNPDFFVIQLDVNDYCFTGFVSGKTFEETSDYIDSDYQTNILPIIQALRTTAPNMKIGISLTPPANGRPGVFFNHFQSNDGLGDTFRWKSIVNAIYRKYTEYFGGREKEGLFLLPIHFGVDDFNHFDDVDPIHPYPSNGDITKPNGYRCASRDIYAWMKNLMQDEALGTCHVNAQSKNIQCDNNGTPANPTDDTFSFEMKVENTFGGTAWQGSATGQSLNGTYGIFSNFGPYPCSSPLELILTDQLNAACQSLFTVSSESCSNGVEQKADLELFASTTVPKPTLFTTFPVVFTVKNYSNVPAQAVWLKIPKPTQVNFPSGNPYSATQGEYDWFYYFLWEVGEVPPQGEASITIDYYLLADEIFPIYAEVYAMMQDDVDSEAHNGNYTTVNEDDEVILMVGETIATHNVGQETVLSVYPNPNNGAFVTLVLPDDMGINQTEIYNAQGQLIRLDNRQFFEKKQIDLFGIPKGIYTIRCLTKENVWVSGRFVRP